MSCQAGFCVAIVLERAQEIYFRLEAGLPSQPKTAFEKFDFLLLLIFILPLLCYQDLLVLRADLSTSLFTFLHPARQGLLHQLSLAYS